MCVSQVTVQGPPRRVTPTMTRNDARSCLAPLGCQTGGSVSEVGELNRVRKVHLLDRGDRGLKVVSLLALDSQLVALDLDLHLELGVPDSFREILGCVLGDPLVQREHGFRASTTDGFDLTAGDGFRRYLATYETGLEDFDGGFDAARRIGLDRDLIVGVDDLGVSASEVVPVPNLTSGLIHGIGHFLRIDLGHDVKRRHDRYSPLCVATLGF